MSGFSPLAVYLWVIGFSLAAGNWELAGVIVAAVGVLIDSAQRAGVGFDERDE
jgi:energy-converting hydrogenase Eha subunit G